MRILDFIFKFLMQFIQFEPGKYDELKEKAEHWYNKEKQKEGESKFKKVIDINEQWYAQVALAIAFMFTVKSVRNWLLSDPTQGGKQSSDGWDEDDEDDENEGFSQMPGRMMKQAVQQFSPFKF